MASRVIQVDNARAMPICDVRTSICLTVVLVYYKDQWRSQYGATAPPDCQGPLRKFVQIPESDYIFVVVKVGGRLTGSLRLLRTDTDPLCLCFLLFKLTFVRLSLLNVYDFNVLDVIRIMPLAYSIIQPFA